MPFLKGGRLAITRTKKYLDSGRIVLNNAVKSIILNHIPGTEISAGCDEFIRWFLPQLQYRNPNVQILTFKNMCPTPFMKVYMDEDEEILINCSFRTHTDIHKHLSSLLGKTTTLENQNLQHVKNPANFGRSFHRQCICEVLGQVPCSAHIGRPKPWPRQEPELPPMRDEKLQSDELKLEQ